MLISFSREPELARGGTRNAFGAYSVESVRT